MSQNSAEDSFRHLVAWHAEAESLADLIGALTFIAAHVVHALEHPEAGKLGPSPDQNSEAYRLIQTWIAAGGGAGVPAGTKEVAAIAQAVGLSLQVSGQRRLSALLDPTALKPRVCGYTGCGCRATQIVGLALRAPRSYGDSECRSYLDLILCDDHAAAASVKSLVSDEGWKQISAALVSAGKVAPDRGRTSAFTEPIDQAPEIFRSRYEPA